MRSGECSFFAKASCLSIYGGVRVASWFLESRAIRIFVQQLVQAYDKGIIKIPLYWPSVRGIHLWPMGFLHKVSVIRKVFSCHDTLQCRYHMSTDVRQWLELSHCGRVTHICVIKLTIIVSDNNLSPGRCQAIIWTNVGILLIWPLGTYYNEIWIEIHIFSFKKMHSICHQQNGVYFISTSVR